MVSVAAAEQPDDSRGLAVISTPETNKLEFFGDRFGETKSGLDRFCTAGKKLDMSYSFREQLADEFEEPGPGLSREAAQSGTGELLAYTPHVMGMAVADAANGDTGDEIEIFIAVDVENRAASRAIDHNLRIKSNRLQAGRHHLGLTVENRF